MQERICSRCERPEVPRKFRRALCDRCYRDDYRHGRVAVAVAEATTPNARIDGSIVTDDNGCWLWSGERSKEGYGRVSVSGRSVSVHRYQYERHVGPIPEGLQLDHLCRVRHCCNPAHLEPVTARENTRRSPLTRASINAGRTHCPKGHGYTADNTYVYRGIRYCRACDRTRSARRYAAKKAMSA